jgi:hypothetical protein
MLQTEELHSYGKEGVIWGEFTSPAIAMEGEGGVAVVGGIGGKKRF